MMLNHQIPVMRKKLLKMQPTEQQMTAPRTCWMDSFLSWQFADCSAEFSRYSQDSSRRMTRGSAWEKGIILPRRRLMMMPWIKLLGSNMWLETSEGSQLQSQSSFKTSIVVGLKFNRERSGQVGCQLSSGGSSVFELNAVERFNISNYAIDRFS